MARHCHVGDGFSYCFYTIGLQIPDTTYCGSGGPLTRGLLIMTFRGARIVRCWII